MILLDGAGAGGSGAVMTIVIYVVFLIAMMYFMAIRPQKKQQQKQQALMDSLKVGSYVLTTAGFYGEVIVIDDDTVIVEFGNNKNCRIPMKKEAIIEIESEE